MRAKPRSGATRQKHRRHAAGLALAVTGLVLLLAGPVRAATWPEIASYAADRAQKLAAGAAQEGTLSVYTSLNTKDIDPVIKAYEAKYKVKVSLWRGSSEQVVQRVVAEARAGRKDVDLILTNGPALEALHREKLLEAVKSPKTANLIPEAIQPAGDWTATQLNVFVAAYNTDLVKKADLPKTYQDLTDPKWKGKIGVEAGDSDWFAGVVMDLGEEKGLKLFREIAKVNGFSVRKGHTLLTNLVSAGEVPLSLTNYSFTAEQNKASGAPFDWFVIPPAMARPNGVAVTKSSQHPNAALLFYDFVLDEGQPMFLKRGFVTVRKDIPTLLNKVPYKFLSPSITLDDGEKWDKLYDSIVVKAH